MAMERRVVVTLVWKQQWRQLNDQRPEVTITATILATATASAIITKTRNAIVLEIPQTYPAGLGLVIPPSSEPNVKLQYMG